MSKQTAVEWLIGMISYTSKDTHSAMESSNFFDKAKAMEREQRFKDFQGGFQAATDAIIGANKSVQSKTYGKEASYEA